VRQWWLSDADIHTVGQRPSSRVEHQRDQAADQGLNDSYGRNLIVHTVACGAKPRDVELLFDGKGYPTNPTVVGPQVKPAAPGGDLVIAEIASPNEARPLH
jgi:hypothetical protein